MSFSHKVSRVRVVFLPVSVAIFFMAFFTYLFGLKFPTVTDVIYGIALVAFLYACSRKNVLFVVNSVLLLFVGYVAGAVKLQYFGEPATLADIVSLYALYGLQSESVQWYAVFGFFFSGLFFLANFVYSRRVFVLLFGAGFVFFSSLLLALNAGSASPWLKGLSTSESVSVRQFYAIVEFYDEWMRVPEYAEVVNARATIDLSLSADRRFQDAPKRDVHLIVIESLWDPSVLGEQYAKGSFHPDFTALWETSGRNYLLGPAYGGGTANPEFEILCGLPLVSGFIVFEHPMLNNNLPCLPSVLKRNGYRTIASHPNRHEFWNRDVAYPAIGFDKYYSIQDFKKDEVIGNNYLTDRSLYRQSTQHAEEGGRPALNYILTVSEHYPYMDDASTIAIYDKGDEAKRLLEAYVRLIERATRDVYDYITLIRNNDKDALIVVVGDHPPLFGADYAIYRDAGLIANEKNRMDVAELMMMYSVPVLVIDGMNGPVSPQIKSLYELPSLIMRMLSCYGQACAVNDNDGGVYYRPISGRGTLYHTDGQWKLCDVAEGVESCAVHLNWLQAADVLRRDVVFGAVHSVGFP
jgi:phosphoglycerol transferase MdoB-like AlkP superfamily enzyme